MDPAVTPLRSLQPTPRGGVAARGEHPAGRGKDLSGAGELHDGTQILAVAGAKG